MVIDFHSHCFNDRLAPAAMANLAKNSQYPPHFDGTIGGLKTSMTEADIDISVVLNIATNPKQNYKVNDWAIESNKIDGIVSFGSINPYFGDYKNEIKRLKDNGVKGIKFHPDYQGYFSDDKKLAYPVYEEIAKQDLIMQFHCGCDLVLREPLHNTPEMFSHIVRDFPGAKIVGAHLGGQNLWNDVFTYLIGKEVYLDTSFGFKFMNAEQIQRVLNEHSSDKILFATDTPWQKQKVEVEEMMAIPMDEKVRMKILYSNGAKLLGIDKIN